MGNRCMDGCIRQVAALGYWTLYFRIGYRLGPLHLGCNRDRGGCSAQVAAYSGFNVLL